VGRTARLSEDCREVLRAASVVSTEWDGDVVCGISGLSLERFSAAIDEGLASGLVRRSSGLERFGFIHALVREMFYSELPTTIRRVLHGKVVAWLELHRSELDQGDVAYHAYHSAALDRGAKALEYSIRAAEHATRGLAYEDAVVHYGRALEMLEFARPRDMKQRRCELMIGLGESLIRCADRSAASEVFHKAAELARDIASGSLLARVALALAPGLTSLELGIQDQKLIPLLDEALELCEDDPEPRSLLLARLAVAQASSLSPDALRPLVDEAIRLADSTGKVPVQAYTRSARCLALWCPRNFDERRQETQDVLVWARRSGDRELQALAHLYRVTTLMEQGDPAAVRGQMAAFERMALELRQPQAIWYSTCFRTLSAFLQGRFTELRRLQAELRAAAQSMADNNPLHVAALHDIYLCAEEGSFERGLELCEEMASIYPPYSSARAWYLAELGRSREARAVADLYIDKGFERILRGMNQLCVLATLTEAVDVLGARDLAIALREEFDPDPDRIVMGGFGFCCWGAAARTLGQLATLLGEWDEAERLFERALELNARIGATVWIVRTRYNYTRMLLARGSSSDRACAREQIALALPVARSIGMSVVAARLEGLAMRAQSSPD
jgi:tetratricopeptide (TPR) repeat protein